MKLYDYALKSTRTQFEQLHNTRQFNEPDYDPTTIEAQDELQDFILRDSMSVAINILARCDVFNDSRNDQIQASARELIKIIADRLSVDVGDKYGVPL